MSAVSAEPVIEARGLGKRYVIRSWRERTLLRQALAWARGEGVRPLWAVRGVDLSVRRGDFVCLVGPNGAGKSTLLMMLAGLLEPTEGRLEVRGRLSPFFRVSAGLYSELSVLDNIRLAGTLFGMTTGDIRRKLESIVAFGELEPYLYARLGELSAGYQARAVFSTALHAPIDIHVVDEVLAVGDAAFAHKCLARVDELRAAGMTMIMSSHNLATVRAYATRVVWLEQGRVAGNGEAGDVIAAYLARHGLTG